MDDRSFMELALTHAEAALEADEFPVGCVAVSGGRVLATGSRTGTAGGGRNETDHAEMLALRQLEHMDPVVPPPEIVFYCTLEPCLMCFGGILIRGIGRIVYAYEDIMGGGAHCDRSRLAPLYRDRTLEIVPGVLRSQSLALFKRFFKNPENRYWHDSLLARYTLAQ